VKHIGLVMSTLDDNANFQVFDVAHGNRTHRNLQVEPWLREEFQWKQVLQCEFFNPVDRKMYKWKPDEGFLPVMVDFGGWDVETHTHT